MRDKGNGMRKVKMTLRRSCCNTLQISVSKSFKKKENRFDQVLRPAQFGG
jgi:hypothetical protein